MNPEQNTPPPPPRQQPLAEQMTEAEIEALYIPLPVLHAWRNLAIAASIASVRDQIIVPPHTAGGELVSFEELKQLVVQSANETGFTVAARRGPDGELVEPTWGFACAAGGTEVKQEEFKSDTSFVDELLEWYIAVRFLLKILGVHFGAWRDENGKYEVNISLVFKSQRDAERFAMVNDQKAIYDVVRDDTINTGGKGRTHWINPYRNSGP